MKSDRDVAAFYAEHAGRYRKIREREEARWLATASQAERNLFFQLQIVGQALPELYAHQKRCTEWFAQ